MSQSHKDTLYQLLPSEISRLDGIDIDLAVEGAALDKMNSEIANILEQAIPDKTTDEQYLTGWEEALKLPNISGQSVEWRRNRIVSKLREKGSLRIAYFVSIAAALGYTIVIKEAAPLMAGVMRCGDRCYAEDGYWQLRVLVFDQAGPIQILEETLNRLKPAETIIEYIYELGA